MLHQNWVDLVTTLTRVVESVPDTPQCLKNSLKYAKVMVNLTKPKQELLAPVFWDDTESTYVGPIPKG